jgi:hypothetical protein
MGLQTLRECETKGVRLRSFPSPPPFPTNLLPGALLLRVINVIYSLDLRWITFIDSQTDANCKGDTLPPEETSSKASETSAFISRLCDILDARLGELSAVFDAISATSQGRYPGESTPLSLPPLPSMLSHGLVLTLKYCLEDVNSNGLLVPSGASPDQQKGRPRKQNKKQSPPSTVATSAGVNWRDTVQRVMKLALRSLQSALQIVAETPMDNYFAPVPKADAGKDHLLQDSAESTACQGEEQREVANTHGYASDSFMLNTNIFMDLEEPSDGLSESKEDSIGRRMQFAVVGAWLLVKESCSLLAKLVEISPPLFVDPMGEESAAADPNSTTLLTIEEIAHIGNVILDALSRLKHNGAIAEAQVSLQSVCESVLKYSGRSNVSLSHLPLTWLHNLINKLNGEQQVFPTFAFLRPLPSDACPAYPSGVHPPKVRRVRLQLLVSAAV